MAAENFLFAKRTTRRQVLKSSGLTAGLMVFGTGLLAACGGSDNEDAPTTSSQPGQGDATATSEASSTSNTDASPAAGEIKRGGTLRMVINQESATIDPHPQKDIAGTQIKGLIYSQLLKYYYDKELVPDLAESYEAEDATTYVFHLREGVKFHDGAPLTAADVKASYDRILIPETGSRNYPYLKVIESVNVLDDLTVEFKLQNPQATFIAAMGLTGNYIAQAAKIEAGVDFQKDVVGTGPFKLASREVDVETRIEKNPDYFLPDMPYLDEVIFRPIVDDTARMNALYSGDADVITYVNWAAMGDLENDDKYDLQSNPEDGFVQIEFRVDRPPFDNPKLRQAVSYAIDREAIIKTATSGRGRANFGPPVPSWMWGYNEELAEYYRFDPEKAKQLIKEAGAEGLEIEYVSDSPDDELFGRPSVVVANYLNQVGLKVTIKVQEVAEWAETRANGNYQMLMDGSLYGLPDPDFMSDYYYTGARIPKANRYSDPEMDAWLDEARELETEEERTPLYDKVQQKAMDDEPISWLFFREQGEATQNDVRGYQYLGSLGATNSMLETWLDR